MLTNVMLHHVTQTHHVTTMMVAIHALVTPVTLVTARHALMLTNVLTHHVPKNHVACAETMMVALLVAVTMVMKVMDTTVMKSMNVKTLTPALKMPLVVTPMVVSSVNATWDISEMVIPHVMILTNAKSLVQITVVSTLPVETLLAALNVLVSMDILVMVSRVKVR